MPIIQPVSVAYPLNKHALTINLECGHCRHFTTVPAAGHGKKLCSKLGIQAEGKPCEKFWPDSTALKFLQGSAMRAFATVLRTCKPEQLRVLASFLNVEPKLRKRGYVFGQMVFVKQIGGDYLFNYRKAYVMSAGVDFVIVSAVNPTEAGKKRKEIRATLKPESVLNTKQWRTKITALLQAGRIHDPDYKKYFKVEPMTETPTLDYTPPTIDALYTFDSTATPPKKKSART